MAFKNPAKITQRVGSPLSSSASQKQAKSNRKSNAPWLKVRRRFKTPMFKNMR